MDKFVLISDSTCDFSRELIDELDVKIIPLTFSIDDNVYVNDPEESQLKIKDFYNLLRQEKASTTSQISVSAFTDFITPFLKEGKDVLYIAFSSGLSGTFNSANVAFEDLRQEFPERKIICVDSLAASMGEGLLVYHAAKMRLDGKTINEVATFVEENRLNLCMWFTVDDLNHLKRGGRVSSTAAFVGTMLGIKPVLHVDNEGHLIPMEKVRGRKASLDALVEHYEKTAINKNDQVVFISHGDCEEDCNYVIAEMKKRFKIKTFYKNMIGPVIGTHSGPGTVALFFLGTER